MTWAARGYSAWSIDAYTYEADTHCVACTLARWQAGRFSLQSDHPDGTDTDEHGVPYAAQDNEGNSVHPVFATDEGAVDDSGRNLGMACGTCGGVIREPDDEELADEELADEELDDESLISAADDAGLDFDILARIGRDWQN